jgi:hypothetical protein
MCRATLQELINEPNGIRPLGLRGLEEFDGEREIILRNNSVGETVDFGRSHGSTVAQNL